MWSVAPEAWWARLLGLIYICQVVRLGLSPSVQPGLHLMAVPDCGP